jgi:hypothetical protein
MESLSEFGPCHPQELIRSTNTTKPIRDALEFSSRYAISRLIFLQESRITEFYVHFNKAVPCIYKVRGEELCITGMCVITTFRNNYTKILYEIRDIYYRNITCAFVCCLSKINIKERYPIMYRISLKTNLAR